MTAPLFAAHPGCHCAARDRAPFFRRLRWRRKPAVPAGSAPAGAATVLLADRFKCCVHCEVPTRCDPADSHPKACSDGCNRVTARPWIPADRFVTESVAWAQAGTGRLPARNDVTMPSGWPILGERMLSEVRADWDRGGLAPARQAAHADAMHAMSARFMPAPPRPVNGRKMPDQPRRTPAVLSGARLEAECDAARAAGEKARARYRAAPAGLLKQVLAGLEAL